MNTEYIIVGDTERYKDCLVCLAGTNKELAKQKLNNIINGASYNDRRLGQGVKNLRIEEVKSEGQWWNEEKA